MAPKGREKMRDFTPEDTEAAANIYGVVDDPIARAMLDYLVDHADEVANAATIREALDLPAHREVAKAAHRIGQACAEAGLRRPFSERQVGYVMSPEIAELFRGVRAAQQAS
jgi:hypothetical protein